MEKEKKQVWYEDYTQFIGHSVCYLNKDKKLYLWFDKRKDADRFIERFLENESGVLEEIRESNVIYDKVNQFVKNWLYQFIDDINYQNTNEYHLASFFCYCIHSRNLLRHLIVQKHYNVYFWLTIVYPKLLHLQPHSNNEETILKINSETEILKQDIKTFLLKYSYMLFEYTEDLSKNEVKKDKIIFNKY